MLKWKTGPAEPNWMEENIPSGIFHSFFHVLTSEINGQEKHNLLLVLNALDVVSYDTFYEDVYQIRIRQRRP